MLALGEIELSTLHPYHVVLADVASDIPCMIGDAIVETRATRSACRAVEVFA